MSIHTLATQYVGRTVAVHCHDGAIHYGVLHHVDRRGIYLQRMQPGVISGTAETNPVHLSELKASEDVEVVFLPLLFIPLLAAAAVYPWYYRPYPYYW